MKLKMLVTFVGLVFSLGLQAAPVSLNQYSVESFEHGGGCRKSSPPGMCCHMETRTGLVHCH